MVLQTRHVVIRALLASGLLVTLAALLVPAAPAHAVVPTQVRESVGYLTTTYHVGTADALRRLWLATAAEDLVRRLSSALPGEYAGARLDQRNGGVLVVAATRPEHARRVVRGLPHRDEIRVVPATYSLRDLARVRDRVAARTGKGGSPQVNEVTNRVEVWTAERAAVTRALAGLGPDRDAVVIRAVPTEVSTACDFYECDPPMRGGISVSLATHEKEHIDYCTAAFNIKDDDGNLFTSTAGHCITDLAARDPRFILSLKNNKVIGDIASVRSVYANTRGPRLDYAFVRVIQTDEWFPSGHSKNAMLFKCSEQKMQPKTCDKSKEDLTYPITGIKNYGAMNVGDVVCMAGASPMMAAVKPGVRCGEIIAKPDGGIQTNICAKKGDSGSPLFDQPTNKAYGIESSVESAATGPCLPAAEQQTNYTPLSEALTAATAAKGRTYSLITD
jgi:streptogrisin C